MDWLEAYHILDLTPGASPSAVRDAYRNKVKAFHPDQFAGNPQRQVEGQEKLVQVNLAYDRLLRTAQEPTDAIRLGRRPGVRRPPNRGQRARQVHIKRRETPSIAWGSGPVAWWLAPMVFLVLWVLFRSALRPIEPRDAPTPPSSPRH